MDYMQSYYKFCTLTKYVENHSERQENSEICTLYYSFSGKVRSIHVFQGNVLIFADWWFACYKIVQVFVRVYKSIIYKMRKTICYKKLLKVGNFLSMKNSKGGLQNYRV